MKPPFEIDWTIVKQPNAFVKTEDERRAARHGVLKAVLGQPYQVKLQVQNISTKPLLLNSAKLKISLKPNEDEDPQNYVSLVPIDSEV